MLWHHPAAWGWDWGWLLESQGVCWGRQCPCRTCLQPGNHHLSLSQPVTVVGGPAVPTAPLPPAYGMVVMGSLLSAGGRALMESRVTLCSILCFAVLGARVLPSTSSSCMH